MKAKLSLLLLPLLAGCVEYMEEVESDFTACPKVEIRQEDKAIVQKGGGYDLFKIEMVGYNGHCYFDERVQKDKAVVAPKFKITRLSNTNVEDVHFSYYLETYEGPTRFLGKKTYFALVRMPKGSFESYYTPDGGELSVPAGKYDFEMFAGLNATLQDSEYKVK
ncbi:MAG: hypothetical protein IJ870_00465 [Alphaproteobacteria bacterium]|nr:hypothetical protein [Alphaproteobacteria bacterium]